jgi:hypothetical protein
VHERICSHPDTLRDLTEVRELIAADNPGASERVLCEIHEAVRALGHLAKTVRRQPLDRA